MTQSIRKLTMGSLFDGISGFPLASVRCGIEPIWASEIEPFPILVSKIRFPRMEQMGDITKLNGAYLPPVDIINLWQSMPGYEHRRKTNRSERQPFFSVS